VMTPVVGLMLALMVEGMLRLLVSQPS
jgi:hypothetical protein